MLEAIKAVFAQTGVQVLAGVVIGVYSLWLVARKTVQEYPQRMGNILDQIETEVARLTLSFRSILSFVLKLLAIFALLKGRTPLGWADVTVTIAIFALANPTVLDLLVEILRRSP